MYKNSSFLSLLLLVATFISAPLLSRSAWAQELPVTTDEHELWLTRPSKDGGFAIFHKSLKDRGSYLGPAAEMRGRLLNGAMTAADGKLWMIYANRSVQSVDAMQIPPSIKWHFDAQIHPALPETVDVQAIAADASGMWVLVRVSDTQTLKQIDHADQNASADKSDAEPEAADPVMDASATKTPEADNTTDDQDKLVAADAVDASRKRISADRLLHLSGAKWLSVALPENWDTPEQVWLVAGRGGKAPTLIAANTTDTATVYRKRADGTWSQSSYDNLALEKATFIRVDQQLILAHEKAVTSEQLQVQLSVIRPEGISQIGTLALDHPNLLRWNAVAVGSNVAVVAGDADNNVVWKHVDLLGQELGGTEPLSIQPTQHWPSVINYLVLLIALTVATLVLMIFWKRDPAENRLELPATLVLSGLGQRAAAGILDLIPCVLLAAAVYDVDPAYISYYWPGRAETLPSMLPGTLAIVFFVLHTGISELLWHRTLGKLTLGIRVTTLKGTPPSMVQLVARNLMKIFDLIAWPLLIMPLIGPYRQRLGDLVARTVVVTDAPPKREESDDPFA